MNAELLDKIFLPADETGDDERVHVWTGIIALLLLAFLVSVKRGFGDRAI